MKKDDDYGLFVDKTSRIIYFNGKVTREFSFEINQYLLEINKDDIEKLESDKDYQPNPIQFFITSQGGYLSYCYEIISMMDHIISPIYTYVPSMAQSCGLLLFEAGDKRYISKYAFLMYHEISDRVNGSITKINNNVYVNIQNQKLLDNIVTSKSIITQERLDEIKDKNSEFFIMAPEAIALKLADEYM